MNRERLIELLNAENFTENDFSEISDLADQYPWFNVAHFLKLKAMHDLKMDYSSDLASAAVYSSDRKHLYKFINGEPDEISPIGLRRTELEFIGGDEEYVAAAISGSSDAFVLETGIDQPDQQSIDEEEDVDMDGVMGISVKEEVDMEEPEVEDKETFPVIDHLEDEEETIGDEQDEDEPEEEVHDRRQIFDTRPILEEISLQVKDNENKPPNLIERFITNEPGVIPADKPTSLTGDVAAGSVRDNDSFITDTLAQIYIKQGLYAKAIYAYERLSLKYPEKSAYFAAQIEKIENISNS